LAALGHIVNRIPAHRAEAKLGKRPARRSTEPGRPIRLLKAVVQQRVDGIRLNARAGRTGTGHERRTHGARPFGADAELGVELRADGLADVKSHPTGILWLGLALGHHHGRNHRHQQKHDYENHHFSFHRFVLSLLTELTEVSYGKS